MSTGGAAIDSAVWNSNGIITLPEGCINAFFRETSLGYGGFQKESKSPGVAPPPGYETYALSPLVRWPLVRRGDGLVVAPIATDLLERPTRGFPIDAQKALEQEASDKKSKLSQAQGDAYEDYVRQSLSASHGVDQLRRGAEILPADSPNCDFVYVEERAAVLVEVKGVRLRLITDYTKDKEILREELGRKNGVADGLIQINESARAIREGRTELSKRLQLNGLLIVRGEQILLNSPFVREILEELVFSRSGKRMMVKYQLCNDAGFVALTQMLQRGDSLSEFLYRKCRGRNEDTEDLHHTVWRGVASLPPHPLANTFQSEFEDLVRTYAPRADE